LTLSVVCLVQAVLAIDSTGTDVAIPDLSRDLNANVSGIFWVKCAYALGIVATVPIYGALGGRFGRKRWFLIGLAIFTVGSALSAMSTDLPALIASRALQGAGGGALLALGLSLLATTFSGSALVRATGMWAIAGAVGFCLGPIVAGVIVQSAGWAWIFWVNVPLCVAAGIVGAIAIREGRDSPENVLDLIGQIILGVTLTLIVLVTSGVTMVVTEDDRRIIGICLAGLGMLVVAVFALRARNRARPGKVVPGALLQRAFAVAMIVGLVANFALITSLYYQSQLVQETRGFDPTQAGLLYAPLAIAVAVSGLSVGRIVQRWGYRLTIAAGLAAAACGAVAISVVAAGASTVWLLLGNFLIGAGAGTAIPANSAVGLGVTPRSAAAAASTMLAIGRQLGTTVGLTMVVGVAVMTTDIEWNRLAASIPGAGQSAAIDSVRVGHLTEVADLGGPTAASAAARSFELGVAWAYLATALALVIAAAYTLRGLRGIDARLEESVEPG
jgi:EmrB/QacA subfamily drug resistance transporter